MGRKAWTQLPMLSVVSLFSSSSQLFMSFCPFLSRLTSLPGSQLFPFPGSSPRAAYFMYLVIILLGGSAVPPHPTTTSVCSSLPPVDLLYPFLLALCPAFSLLSTSFSLGTGQHIPLFHAPPTLPPLRSQRRWQPRCRMREGAPRPGSRSRPRSPVAL